MRPRARLATFGSAANRNAKFVSRSQGSRDFAELGLRNAMPSVSYQVYLLDDMLLAIVRLGEMYHAKVSPTDCLDDPVLVAHLRMYELQISARTEAVHRLAARH